MRSLETLTLFFLLTTTILLFIDKKRSRFLVSLIITTVTIIAQYYVGGIRWQLGPCIYLMLAMYIIHRRNNGRLKQHHKALITTWFLVASATPIIIPIFSLPSPEGNYAIGTEVFHWVDSSKSEWFTPENTKDYREIMVQLWYPGVLNQRQTPEPYMDYIKLRTKTIAAAGKLPSFLPSHLNLVETHSYKNLTCINKSSALPVVVFSHGLTGSRYLHQSLFENLASFGYIVAALDHSYDCNLTVFPDGRTADYRSDITGHPDSVKIRKRQIETRSHDIRFVLDQIEKIQSGKIQSSLNGKLNLHSIAVGGHSYGGATAILSAQEDDRIQACFNLDGWINPLPNSSIKMGLNIPIMYMGRPSWNDSDYPNNYSHLKNLMANTTSDKYHLIIKKTMHLDYTDIPLYSPIIKYIMDVGELPHETSISVINQLVKGFLDYHLLNKSDKYFRSILSRPLIINL